jgi:hypothetical protein
VCRVDPCPWPGVLGLGWSKSGAALPGM